MKPELVDCLFQGIKIDQTAGNFRNCRFEDCAFRIYGKQSFERCQFSKTGYELINNYAISPCNSVLFNLEPQKEKPVPELSITNSNFTCDGKNPVFGSWGNQPVDASVTVTDCKINGISDEADPLFGKRVLKQGLNAKGNSIQK